MISNLILLPSMLLTLEKRLSMKKANEPFLEIFDDDEDIDIELLETENKTKTSWH